MPRSRRKKNSLRKRVNRLEARTRPESKHQNVTATHLTISWTGDLNQMLTIDQGLSATQRVGNRIFCKSIQLNMDMFRGAEDCFLRIIVWLVKDEATITTTSDLLASTGSDKATVSAYKLGLGGLFKILSDRTYSLDTYHPQKQVKMFLKINKYFQYTNTADLQPNHWNLFYTTVSNKTAVNGPTAQIYYRSRFTDV